jgi:hypothetical protein
MYLHGAECPGVMVVRPASPPPPEPVGPDEIRRRMDLVGEKIAALQKMLRK